MRGSKNRKRDEVILIKGELCGWWKGWCSYLGWWGEEEKRRETKTNNKSSITDLNSSYIELLESSVADGVFSVVMLMMIVTVMMSALIIIDVTSLFSLFWLESTRWRNNRRQQQHCRWWEEWVLRVTPVIIQRWIMIHLIIQISMMMMLFLLFFTFWCFFCSSVPPDDVILDAATLQTVVVQGDMRSRGMKSRRNKPHEVQPDNNNNIAVIYYLVVVFWSYDPNEK